MKQAFTQNKYHSRVLLSGILTLEKIKEAETPDTNTRGWTHNRAFTLIELLVVVLIIGILAAVALPQYQKAVYKSRAVQAVVMLKAINQAQEAYYMANGAYTDDLTELDIEVPAKYLTASDIPQEYYYQCREKRTCVAYASDPNLPTFEFSMLHGPYAQHNGKQYCSVNYAGATELAKAICQNMGTLGTAENSDWYVGKYFILN